MYLTNNTLPEVIGLTDPQTIWTKVENKKDTLNLDDVIASLLLNESRWKSNAEGSLDCENALATRGDSSDYKIFVGGGVLKVTKGVMVVIKGVCVYERMKPSIILIKVLHDRYTINV
ncbi:hypothetical protein ACLOJK_009176 [Asimina triloba]